MTSTPTTVSEAIEARFPLPCSTVDPDLFFADNPADIGRAQMVCADCPVRNDCLTTAVARGERLSVWGGMYLTQHGTPGVKYIRFRRATGECQTRGCTRVVARRGLCRTCWTAAITVNRNVQPAS